MPKFDSLFTAEDAATSQPATPVGVQPGGQYDFLFDAPPTDKLSASLFEASGTNPDEEAKKLKLSKELDIPAGILPADAEAQAQAKRNNPELIAQETPRTATFLETNAKVVGGDGVAGLQNIERAQATYSPEAIKTFINEYTATGRSAAEAAQKLGDLKKQGVNLADINRKREGRSWSDVLPDTAKGLAATANIMTAGFIESSRYFPVTRLVNGLTKALTGADVTDVLQTQANEGQKYWAEAKSPQLQSTIKEFEKAGIVDSIGMLLTSPSLLADQLLPSSVYLLPGMGVAKAGPAAMLGYNALQEAMDSANSARQEAIAAGSSKSQQDSAAAAAAIIAAPLAFLGNKLAGTGLLEANFLTKGSTGHSLLSTVVREFVSGAFEEGGNTLGVNTGASITFDPNRDILAGVGKSAVIGGLLESFHGGAMSTAEIGLRKLVGEVESAVGERTTNTVAAADAEAAHSTMQDLTLQAQENALLKRSPEAFHEFATTMAEDGNLPEVYVSGKVLDEALAAAGIPLSQLQETMPEVATQLREAVSSEGLVRIPTADYLTHLASTKAGDLLLPELRATPEGSTYSEAREFYQTQQADFEKQAEAISTENAELLTREDFDALKAAEAVARPVADEATTVEGEVLAAIDEVLTPEGEATTVAAAAPVVSALPATYEEYVAQHANKRAVYAADVKAVEDSIKNQFRATGRFTPSVGAAYATPLVEFYKTQAALRGTTPGELFAKYPYLVQNFVSGSQARTLSQGQTATLQDFSKENVKDILTKSNWTILTAENPGAQELSTEENASRMAELEAQLKQEGIAYQLVDGHYGRPEKSVILFGSTPEQALALGRKYDQESVLTRDGYIYQDGTRTPVTGEVTVHDKAPEDFFTTVTLPDGSTSMFTIDLDFDTRLQPGEVYIPFNQIGAVDEDTPDKNVLNQSGEIKVGQVAIKGVHFSTAKRPILNGSKYGTGIKGAEGDRLGQSRDPRIKSRIYFYVDEGKGVFPEYGVGSFRHEVTLPNMYDGARNPQKFPTRNAKGDRDMNLFESAVIDAGFDGYYVQDGFGRQGSAVVLGDASRSLVPDSEKPVADAMGNVYDSKQELEQVVKAVPKARKFGEEIATAFKTIAAAKGTTITEKVNAKTFGATLQAMAVNAADLEISQPKQIGKGRTRVEVNNTVTGHSAYLIDNGKGEIWVDLSELKSKKDRGNVFYAAAADYAFYNDKVFIGDPAGLSDVALFRRTENMLAIALKYGTTKHIAPHMKQTEPQLFADQFGSGKFSEDAQALRWKEGDDDFNIASLAYTGYVNLTKLFPEITNARWNPESGAFEWADGRPFDADAVAAYSTVRSLKENGYGDLVSRSQDVDSGTSESSPIGGRTLRRGLITQTILQGASAEERGSILTALGSRLRRASVSEGLDTDFSGLLYQAPREKWYFSTLAESINSAKQDNMPASQWKSWLAGNAPKLGIKQAEIQWTGINEWLDLQDGKVNKAGIIEYLTANGVQVQETALGAAADRYEVMLNDDDEWDVVDNGRPFADGSLRVIYTDTERLGAQDYADELTAALPNETKYSSYTVPGGENYKELLLTLPETKTITEQWRVVRRDGGTDGLYATENQAKAIADSTGGSVEKAESFSGVTGFRSSHFNKLNILAHVRFDERTDANGKKVLFIHEIQSDWGQEGKKKGFAEKYNPADVEAIPADSAEADQPNVFWYFRVPGNVLQVPKSRYATEEDARAYVLTKNTVSGGPLPKAPFVTDTKAWVGLALKRMASYAVEHGFESVAIINGEQAAGLYDLSKQVDVIRAFKRPEGTYFVTADGREVGNEMSEGDLENAIGKDLAKKIIDGDNKGTDGFQEFSGVDLQVGGEGMKTFYDKIVPQVANDILKKIGGGKVAPVNVAKKGRIGTGVRAEDVTRALTEGSVTAQLGFTITPEMVAQAEQGLPLFQNTLGSFNVDTLTTTLLAGANFSTVIHESGHFYLKMLETLGGTTDAPAQVVEDYQKALEWFGVTRAAWEDMTLEEQRPYHEQWAESFERWNLEGKAPTYQLQATFSRFRAWLLSVYESMEKFLELNPGAGKLNDEVRGIFSRLLASKEAIEATEKSRGYVPLFTTAAEAGVTQTVFDEYIALGKEATSQGVDALQARSLRDMKWVSNARNTAIKDLQAQAQTQRETIRSEVTLDVMNEPVNQARAFLRKGEIKDPTTGDLIKLEKGYKLDTTALKEMYPESALDTPDLTNLRGMTSKEGLAPDVLAEMFGFDSGDALVRTLLSAEVAKEKIDGLTDQRMLEEFGDLIDQRSIQRAADEAVHNEARAKFMATGLKMMTNSSITPTQMAKAAKEAANNAIARKKVRDIKPNQYTAAESRSSKEVMKLLPKDPSGAAAAQRSALLNNRLATAANDALKEVEKSLAYLGKFNKDTIRKAIDIEYVEQIDALLEPFNLRKGLSLTTIDSNATLADWVAQQEALGYEPTIDPEAIASLRQKSYKNMTMEEVRALVDTAKQIEHMGRMKKKLLTAQDNADFAARIAEARASIEMLAGKKSVTEYATPTDAVGLIGRWGRQMAAAHRKFSSFLRELDGGRDNGVMFNLLMKPAAQAANRETDMRGDATSAIATLFDPIMKSLSKSYILGNIYAKKKVVPGTDFSMTHEQRLMFGMNWGNEGNRQRLVDGGLTGKKALSEAEAAAILSTITKDEWDFIQGTWDYIATYKPLIEAQERQLTGKTPEWVAPVPVVTEFGIYAGGYFPAKYDRALSTRSDALEAMADLRMAMKGAFGSSSARNGYAKARAEAVKGRPLLLSFSTIQTHLNEVIHRVAWQPWLIDAGRVIRALDGDLRLHLGAEALAEITKMKDDIATGEAQANGPVEIGLNRLRTGTTIVGLGWKLSTALLQPLGLSNSWAQISTRHMAKGVSQYIANPIDSAAWVVENSTFMKNRASTMNRNINEILNTVRVGKNSSAIESSFFYLIGKLQRVVDVPTYLGAYEQSLEQQRYELAASAAERKVIEEQAHAVAEQTVKNTQGGGELQDLASVQRGGPLLKLFTNFYSYMNTVYNMNVNAFRGTNFRSPSEVGIFTADMILINFVPVVLSVVLKNILKGSCDWDDAECLAGKYISEQTSYLAGQLVGMRELSGAIDAATGMTVYGYSGPAGLRFFADITKLSQQVAQGDADLALFKAANNVGGTLFHYPAGQINNTVDGIVAIQAGEVEGFGMAQALISGSPK